MYLNVNIEQPPTRPKMVVKCQQDLLRPSTVSNRMPVNVIPRTGLIMKNNATSGPSTKISATLAGMLTPYPGMKRTLVTRKNSKPNIIVSSAVRRKVILTFRLQMITLTLLSIFSTHSERFSYMNKRISRINPSTRVVMTRTRKPVATRIWGKRVSSAVLQLGTSISCQTGQ